MNKLPVSIRIAAFIFAILAGSIHIWFLRDNTSPWQVAPTSLAMGSVIVACLICTFFGGNAMKENAWAFKSLLISAMTFVVGLCWLFVAGGDTTGFYKILGTIAAVFATVVLFIPNRAIRRDFCICH